jgi:hypothetical protein
VFCQIIFAIESGNCHGGFVVSSFIHTLTMAFLYINGNLRVSEELPYTYDVFEKNHMFIKTGEHFYRTNELWRKKVAKTGNGEVLATEFLQNNFARVMYIPESYILDENMSAVEREELAKRVTEL